MSSIIVQPKISADQTRPAFSGRARWAAAGVVVAGGLLQAVEFLLERPLDDNAARLAYWSEHLARIGLSQGARPAAGPATR
jgi:hypothetical protein